MKTLSRTMVFIAWLIISHDIQAQTIVPGGYVSGNWDSAGSPYIIEGDLLVHPDSAISIGPGTHILFRGEYRLEIQGQLLVNGTADMPVRFAPETEGERWKGIIFNSTDSSITDSSILVHGLISNCYQNACLNITSSSRLRVSDFTIREGNSFQGGGIRCANSNPCFENLLVENNVGLDGAGIFLESSSPGLRNCVIQNNSADGAGGGMVIFSGSSPRLENCAINDNYSFGSGGGIYINGSDPVFIHCEFSGNLGAWGGGTMYSGGAVSVKLDSSPYFENCVFSSNNCNSSGGGIASFSPNEIINCLFKGNHAPVSGGALFLSSGFPVESNIYNNTFSNNESPDGSALYAHNHVAVMKNCVVWQTEVQDTSSLLRLDSFMALEALDVSYCDLKDGQNGIELSGNASYNWGIGNIDLDPHFIPETYELDWNSPCIEAGTPDTSGLGLPELDLAGFPRISNNLIDIGAFEFQNPLSIQHPTFNIQHLVRTFPNPANQSVSIRYPDIFGNEDKEIIIYNSLGIPLKIMDTTQEFSSLRADISELPAGLYFVVMMVNGTKTGTGKLIVTD